MPLNSAKSKQARTTRAYRRPQKCDLIPTVKDVLYTNTCPDCCLEQTQTDQAYPQVNSKPDDISIWSWELKQKRYGTPPSKSQFRTEKFRWQEQEKSLADNAKGKFINPFTRKKRLGMSGAQKRKIVERWGKMWDSALSDLQFDRTVFENNPDAEQTYKTDNERINDGCQKLCEIAKMNQNIITMMMKKFVSGPPNKLYTLNRIEAAQCWSRIINNYGRVHESCCVDLPHRPSRRKFNISALQTPKCLQRGSHFLGERSTFQLPVSKKTNVEQCMDQVSPVGESTFKRNPTYWLDPKLVPPVPPGFKEDEFRIDPKNDPTGEIRRDLLKAKETAKRYTRFAHIIERAVHVIPNLERVEQTMDEHFVSKDPQVRRQTLLHNFFSSPKMDTSPEFKKDALYATILSRNDNPKGAVVKKPFPYSLAETSKSKSKSRGHI